jgi:hypothetical protein
MHSRWGSCTGSSMTSGEPPAPACVHVQSACRQAIHISSANVTVLLCIVCASVRTILLISAQHTTTVAPPLPLPPLSPAPCSPPCSRPGYSWSTLDYTTTVPVPAQPGTPAQGGNSSGNATLLGSEYGGGGSTPGTPVRLQLGGPRWKVAHYAVKRVFAPVSILWHINQGRIKVDGQGLSSFSVDHKVMNTSQVVCRQLAVPLVCLQLSILCPLPAHPACLPACLLRCSCHPRSTPAPASSSPSTWCLCRLYLGSVGHRWLHWWPSWGPCRSAGDDGLVHECMLLLIQSS